jgi:hypothetical protein
VEEFCHQLKEAEGNLSREMERAMEQRRKVQAELSRLVAAVADGGHSTFLMEAIEQREQELQNLDERLQACGPRLQQVEPADVTGFVKSRLATLCDLLNSDVTQARAELLRHVSEIRLVPRQTDNGRDYIATGNGICLEATQKQIERVTFWVYALGWLRGLDLNQRPPGYEPDELPGCSTPRNDDNRCTRRGQIARHGAHGAASRLSRGLFRTTDLSCRLRRRKSNQTFSRRGGSLSSQYVG